MTKGSRTLMPHSQPTTVADIRPLLISSYPPRKCGIATFTRDLRQALTALTPFALPVVALEGDEPINQYGPEVRAVIPKNYFLGYQRAAQVINQSTANVVSLQHEYGLFGGDNGIWITHLLEQIEPPVVTTFHTILERPTPLQRAILLQITAHSNRIITMVEEGRHRLIHHYGVDAQKIVVIPHGTTPHTRSTGEAKARFGWASKRILLMSGLLGPSKGVEYVIEALPEIVRQFPNTLFIIAGQTHPEIVKLHGEHYRQGLLRRATELGVAKHIQTINHYLDLDDLLALYDAADIYLTPHLNEQQITSGTLAYALGMGKACISTPYVYARETLGHGRGLLVKFANSASIAEAVLAIFQRPELQHDLERRAYALGETMFWPEVAKQYIETFEAACLLPAMEPHAPFELASSRPVD